MTNVDKFRPGSATAHGLGFDSLLCWLHYLNSFLQVETLLPQQLFVPPELSVLTSCS